MRVMGIIFANINNRHMFEVTKSRTLASIPIGGRYRLIDFVLSNMVNSNIRDVALITRSNYQSLMVHLGSGKEWDLARKNGGLVILPPFGISDEFYNSRLESLKSIISHINRTHAEYVLLSDCYHVLNIDHQELIKFHLENKADITGVYGKSNLDVNIDVNVLTLEGNRVVDINYYKCYTDNSYISLDMWLMKKSLVQELILEAITHNKTSLNRELLKDIIQDQKLKVLAFRFDGYIGTINSLESFYQVNMDLLNKNIRDELFKQKNRFIYTRVTDSPPTKYGENAKVINSIVADGCYIDGVVENSIIFRGTKICKDTVVKDSIIMEGNTICSKNQLEKVITDHNVQIIHSQRTFGSPNKLTYIKRDTIL